MEIKYTMKSKSSLSDTALINDLVDTFMRAAIPPPPDVPTDTSRVMGTSYMHECANWVRRVKGLSGNCKFVCDSPTMTDDQIGERLEAVMGAVGEKIG